MKDRGHIQTTGSDQLGKKINGNSLSQFRFSDDIVPIASTYEELQIMISRLEATLNEANEVGPNMRKGKGMSNTEQVRNMQINGHIQLNMSMYLGQVLKLNKDNHYDKITRGIILGQGLESQPSYSIAEKYHKI